jgi:TonB family protein
MKNVDYPEAIPARLIFYVLILTSVFIATITSCCRSGKNYSSQTIMEPPMLPPPPKIPSMTGSDTTWDMVDQVPMFPGGQELLMKYIAMNTNYPESAKEKGIQGKVVVKFRITSRGNVNGYQITKSVSPDLDAEALRVVKTITKFEPAVIDGKTVSGWYYLPITFTLK